MCVYMYFLKILFIFRERGREGERNINVWLPLTCPMGTWSATQASTLTGNQTGDPLVRSPELNPLSLTSQGSFILYFEVLLISVGVIVVERTRYSEL